MLRRIIVTGRKGRTRVLRQDGIDQGAKQIYREVSKGKGDIDVEILDDDGNIVAVYEVYLDIEDRVQVRNENTFSLYEIDVPGDLANVFRNAA